MRLVVTGCARSGTVWISNVLSNLGLKVGHEHAIGFGGLCSSADKLDAEVSWLAAPYLDDLPDDVVVWHQVRDPRKVIRCCLHNRYFESEKMPPVVGEFIRESVNISEDSEPLSQAVSYWYRWNKMIERRTSQRYLIEELNAWNLSVRLKLSGLEFSEEEVFKAIENVRGTNACPTPHTPETEMSWSDLASTGSGSSLLGMAENYGYETC